jgi:hypothetical protein
MNTHLAEHFRSLAASIGKTNPRMVVFPFSPHAVPVPGGTGWHGSAALAVRHRPSFLTLPPCSPELNPLEHVWHCLQANGLAISVFGSHKTSVNACCTAWNRFANDPETATSLTPRPWAQVT